MEPDLPIKLLVLTFLTNQDVYANQHGISSNSPLMSSVFYNIFGKLYEIVDLINLILLIMDLQILNEILKRDISGISQNHSYRYNVSLDEAGKVFGARRTTP